MDDLGNFDSSPVREGEDAVSQLPQKAILKVSLSIFALMLVLVYNTRTFIYASSHLNT